MPHTDSPCDHCAAPCCRHYTVVLSGLDAYRMAVALKVPPEDFCELRWTEKTEGHYQILLSGAAAAIGARCDTGRHLPHGSRAQIEITP